MAKAKSPGILRQNAEARLKAQDKVPYRAPHLDSLALLHELKVHQIELEMQLEELTQSQQALAESRQRYFELYEFAPIAYINLGQTGLIDELNLSSLALLMYEKGNILDRPFSSFVAPEEIDRWQQFLLAMQGQQVGKSCEIAMLRGDASRLHVRLDCQPSSPKNDTQQLHITLSDIAEKITLVDELYRQETRRSKIAHHLIDVEEAERHRLAMEIHDAVTPNLSAIQILFGIIVADLSPHLTTDLTARIKDVKELIEDTHGHLRGICANLRPAALDNAGLYAAVEDFTWLFAQRMGIVVELTGGMAAGRLSAKVETLLFRITQEALANCAKHALATRITIELGHDCENAHLEIVDNGIGFNTSDNRLWGLGLLTMSERAELAGGTFRLDSQPGMGTKISVEI